MSCVLDASAALALLAPSQTTVAARAFAADLPDLLAPTVFSIEVRHALLRIERRGGLRPNEADAALAALEAAIAFAPWTLAEAARLADLARAQMCGYFDIQYVDLALARRVRLATRDGPLAAIAARLGVEVIDLR